MLAEVRAADIDETPARGELPRTSPPSAYVQLHWEDLDRTPSLSTALGAALAYNKLRLARIGGVLIIAFGLYMMGAVKINAFDRDQRVHLDRKPIGYLGSVLVGMAFAAGWTPCIGPILGAILGMAGTSGDVTHGVLLLLSLIHISEPTRPY